MGSSPGCLTFVLIDLAQLTDLCEVPRTMPRTVLRWTPYSRARAFNGAPSAAALRIARTASGLSLGALLGFRATRGGVGVLVAGSPSSSRRVRGLASMVTVMVMVSGMFSIL